MRRAYLPMRTEGRTVFSKRIRRCSVDGRKRYENDKCGGKSFWKRSKTASFSFENGLAWTGPICRHRSSCFCFVVAGGGGIVSVVCSIVLSKGCKPFMRDLKRAAKSSKLIWEISFSDSLKWMANLQVPFVLELVRLVVTGTEIFKFTWDGAYILHLALGRSGKKIAVWNEQDSFCWMGYWRPVTEIIFTEIALLVAFWKPPRFLRFDFF